MNFNVIVSAAAYEDLEESADWYEDHFYKCLLSLEDNPNLVSIRYDDVRIKYITRFPFGIHFLVEGNVVKIFAVFSTRRDPIKWKNRLKDER